jgi:predicted PurR-regulated permease PerM
MSTSDLHFARRVGIVLVMVSLTLAFIALVTFAFHFILVVFAGILLAVLLDGLTGQLRARVSMPHGAALAVVLITLLALIGGFVWLIGPQVVAQGQELQERLPEAVEAAEGWLASYGWGQALLDEASDLSGMIGGVVAQLTGVFTTMFSAIFYTVIALFVGLYGAARPALYVDNAIHLVPKRHKQRAREVIESVARALRHWFLGQFIAMVAVGTLTTIGLMLLGVPQALSLGLLAGLLEFVPYLGPIAVSVPIVLVGLLQGPEMALYVGIFFLIVQQLESYVITPMAQQFAVSLPPALLILGQVFFGILGGLPGVILATPLLVAAIVVIQLVYVEDVVGDEVEPLGED